MENYIKLEERMVQLDDIIYVSEIKTHAGNGIYNYGPKYYFDIVYANKQVISLPYESEEQAFINRGKLERQLIKNN